MNSRLEQNKTLRLLKGKKRPSLLGRSSCGSRTFIGSAVTEMSTSTKKKQPIKDKRKIKVLDEEGLDVTPRPLTQSDPDAPKQSLFFLDEGNDSDTDHTTIHSFTTSLPVDVTTLWTKSSQSLEPEQSLSAFEPQRPLRFQHEKTESVVEVTEDLLEELVHICLSETDTVSLLDIPSSELPDDAEEAEQQEQNNRRELCKTKVGNDKFAERAMQTSDNAPKSKRIQTDSVVTAEAGSMAMNSDIYDGLSESTAGSLVRSASQGIRGRPGKNNSTTGTATPVSALSDIDGSQSKLQTVMSSKEFLHSLLVVERTVVENNFQQQLASYKKIPLLPDPDRAEAGEQDEEEEGKSAAAAVHRPEAPALNLLWSFSCELTEGCVVTSLSWHKENANILAVGYDCSAHNKETPGLICVWSLKNLTWPEQVVHSHSVVTTVDFSPIVFSLLGVGMMDGTVAIYSAVRRRYVSSSAESPEKHRQQVCLVSWTKRVLVSVSLDGFIKSWVLGHKGLECTVLFPLKSIKNNKKDTVTVKKPLGLVEGDVAQGLCFHFHPADSSIYLAGTKEGLIYMCSFPNTQDFLEKYEQHFCPVNALEWSPFSPDLFLSGSSDWTVQLWRWDSPTPVLEFSSSQTAVYGIRWSPKWPTVFAALRAEQLEIWDLKNTIQDPTLVLSSEAVGLTSVQFSPEADAVVVGDAQGEVKVYQLHNLGTGSDGKVINLEDVI